MPRDFSRTLRVADQIQRELADLVQNEIKDPRVRQITITAVEVTRDYSNAKVFYTTLCSKEENVLVEKGLEHAKGFFAYPSRPPDETKNHTATSLCF